MHVLGGLYAWLWRNQNSDLFYALLIKKKDLDKYIELFSYNKPNKTAFDYFEQMALLDQIKPIEMKLRKRAAVIGVIWTIIRIALPPITVVLDIIMLRHINKKYAHYKGLF